MGTLLRKRPHVAVINEQRVEVASNETLLAAALRQGIDFPNSCRVGGCGACKCKLSKGTVKELTETAYLLSSEELDQRTILACQSIPTSDVTIDVDIAARAKTTGTIVAQQRLTHDIVRIEIELSSPLAYRAGQFAKLRVEGIAEARSYSFATAPSEERRASFIVRKVPGGALSPLLCGEGVVGREVEVEGPFGDFWLRKSGAPILMIAGGSGLAPILSMLEQARAEGITRSITVLFGARRQRDLYALERFAELERAFEGRLRFVPILSDAQGDNDWQGARGLVTEAIDAHLEPGAHAYLCGPPAMVDAAVEMLAARGIPRSEIHFDRFTTMADAPGANLEADQARAAYGGSPPPVTSERAPEAGLFDYAKYFLFHVIGLFAAGVITLGGSTVTVGVVTILVLYVIGDGVLGDDKSTPRFRYPQILTMQLWLALPLLALILFTSVWTMCPGDPLGFGAWVTSWSGYDIIASREATTFGQHVWAWLGTGLMIGLVGTIPAHELTHRTWDPISMGVGRWLLAPSFDTIFAIEHVYGHHRYVSTLDDPATAPRGRNVYAHIVISTIRGNVSAWHIERRRLEKRRLPVLSWHNMFLRGHAMSVLLVAGAFAMGGWKAALYFIACALWGKALLEIVNYMEHYGIVRNPATPVQPRHSWNTNRRVSSWTMFNLTRHSHHHAQGEVPYQDLRPYEQAPMMLSGYLTTIIVALVPPLWHSIMTPKVLAWDRDFATDEERKLAAKANARSGIQAFEAAAVREDEGSRELAARAA